MASADPGRFTSTHTAVSRRCGGGWSWRCGGGGGRGDFEETAAQASPPAWASTAALLPLVLAAAALLLGWWSASKRRSQERSPWPAHKSATRRGGGDNNAAGGKLLGWCEEEFSLAAKKCAWTCEHQCTQLVGQRRTLSPARRLVPQDTPHHNGPQTDSTAEASVAHWEKCSLG